MGSKLLCRLHFFAFFFKQLQLVLLQYLLQKAKGIKLQDT